MSKTTKKSRRKIGNTSKNAGRFHQTKNSKNYYILLSIAMWLFIGFLYIGIPNSNMLKFHAIGWFIIFMVFNIFAMFRGLYKKKEAHQFYESAKAVDIWLHILGMFSFYLIIYVFLNSFFGFSAVDIIFVTFFVGILWELFEYLSQTTIVLIDKKQKPDAKKYSFWLREEFGNIAQDVLDNLIGIFLGYLYLLWILQYFI